MGASHDPEITGRAASPGEDAPLTDEERETTLASRQDELASLMAEEPGRADEFLCQLELWIIDGYSYAQRRRMALDEYGVDKDAVDKIEALIKQGWKVEQMDPDYVLGSKNMLRLRYTSVFQMAKERGDLKLALRTLDSMAKVAGLWQNGDVVVNVDARGDVTSNNRARIAYLLEKMREHATGRAKLPSKDERAGSNPGFGMKRVLSEVPRPVGEGDGE